jgi:hypothetical protein
MQVLLFIIISPPETSIVPTFFKESKCNEKSRCPSVKQSSEVPHIWTALKLLSLTFPFPSVTPPKLSDIIRLKVDQKGTLISPVFKTWPVNANVFIPGEDAVPSL